MHLEELEFSCWTSFLSILLLFFISIAFMILCIGFMLVPFSFHMLPCVNKMPRKVLWWTLIKKGVPIKYIDIIKDMYDGVVTNVRTYGGITSDFSITIELHQGSALSPFLFVIVMDELTRAIQDEIP